MKCIILALPLLAFSIVGYGQQIEKTQIEGSEVFEKFEKIPNNLELNFYPYLSSFQLPVTVQSRVENERYFFIVKNEIRYHDYQFGGVLKGVYQHTFTDSIGNCLIITINTYTDSVHYHDCNGI